MGVGPLHSARIPVSYKETPLLGKCLYHDHLGLQMNSMYTHLLCFNGQIAKHPIVISPEEHKDICLLPVPHALKFSCIPPPTWTPSKPTEQCAWQRPELVPSTRRAYGDA